MKALGNNCSEGHKYHSEEGHRTELKLLDGHQRTIGSEMMEP